MKLTSPGLLSKLNSKLLLGLLLILSPMSLQALGVGKLTTTSAFNEPFEAEIELLAVEPGELDSVKVGLASEDAFAKADVARTYLLSKLNFEAVQKTDGASVIRVFSRDPVSEPYMNFLIEVSWPKGQVVREFAVLLDVN